MSFTQLLRSWTRKVCDLQEFTSVKSIWKYLFLYNDLESGKVVRGRFCSHFFNVNGNEWLSELRICPKGSRINLLFSGKECTSCGFMTNKISKVDDLPECCKWMPGWTREVCDLQGPHSARLIFEALAFWEMTLSRGEDASAVTFCP